MTILLLAVALTGCQSTTNYSSKGFTPINNFSAVKEGVASRLKDPDSVKFRNLVERLDEDGTPTAIYCGEFNGKNSYGGYAGYTLYVAYVEKGELQIHTNAQTNSDPFGNLFTSKYCGGINNLPSILIEK